MPRLTERFGRCKAIGFLLAPTAMKSEGWIPKARRWAKSIKRDVHAIWLAGRDPRTPLVAKLIALAVAAYAVSPIDLIPDFIPVLGYLDDLIIVPLGIMVVARLIPPVLMAEYRAIASASKQRPVSYIAAILILGIWVACAVVLVKYYFSLK